MNILSKFQLPSFYSLGVEGFWIYFDKGWPTQLINYKGVCRTAPAEPGLLTILTHSILWKKRKNSDHFSIINHYNFCDIHTDRQTDMATLWPTGPRGPSRWTFLHDPASLWAFCRKVIYPEFIPGHIWISVQLYCISLALVSIFMCVNKDFD